MSATNENISPQVIKRVAKEVYKLASNSPEGIKIHTNDDDITDIQATLTGPEGTPYEGGYFRMKIVLGQNFPTAPPTGFFITKIFHPNVAKNGSICVNTLKRDWKPEYGLEHVLTVCKCLLIHPNPASALNEEAGKLLLEQYDDFARHAKMMTEIHAKPTESDLADAKAKRPAEASGTDAIAAKKANKGKANGKKKADKKRALKRL